MELQQKGISGEILESLSDRFSENSELELIRRLILKKKVDVSQAEPQELQKLYRYLAGKGFSYEDIRSVIGQMQREPYL